jgi:hypothetical protein
MIDKHSRAAMRHGEQDKIFQRWVSAGLKKDGKSKGGLAKVLGVHASQVTRILEGTRKIKATEVSIISAYLGEPAPIIGEGVLTAPDAHSSLVTFGTKQIEIIAEVGGGMWFEAETLDSIGRIDAAHPAVPSVPDQRYNGMKQFAVKVAGKDMDRVIPQGFYAVCIPYREARNALTENDVVLVERYKNGLVEGSLRRVRKSPPGWELRPESSDPKQMVFNLAADFALSGGVAETLRVIGLVIWIGAPMI